MEIYNKNILHTNIFVVYKITYRRALGLAAECAREQRYLAYKYFCAYSNKIEPQNVKTNKGILTKTQKLGRID